LQCQPAGVAADASRASYFGTDDRENAGLIGIFYDLKQTQTRENKRANFTEIVAKFIDSGWDEFVLRDFYRVSRALHTTQIFIPYMDARAAPEAFGVAQTVKPSHWLIHYKGQVQAPRSGRFRFVGLADDMLAVAVNGETSLVASHHNVKVPTRWRSSVPTDTKGPCGPLIYGDWFSVKQGEIFDLDIVIGEIPGGGFGAWLQIQEEGVSYPESDTPHTRFPVFQMRSEQLDPAIFKWGKVPFYSLSGDQWTGVR
jgi:hypothetical protein